MRILVLGGYGLIGLPVARRLAAAGHQVTGLGRTVASAREAHPDIAWIERDIARLTDPGDWRPMIEGMDAVVNCSGALQDGPRDKLQALQSDAMKALFEGCRDAGTAIVVQISAVGVSQHAATPFIRTKTEADTALMESDLSWIVLRPGLVIAPAAFGGTAAIRALASFPVVVPLFAGDPPIQTVSVGDVADAVLAGIEGRVPLRGIYDLVEDQAYPLGDVVATFRSWLGLPPAPILKLPSSIGRAVFAIGDALGWLGWRSPLRTTAFVQLNAGVQGDPEPWADAVGHRLSSLRETLGHLPSTVQERWFARLWLLKPVVIATLALFWLASGVVGILHRSAAAAVLTDRGLDLAPALLLVLAGSGLDLVLGAAILFRRATKTAALGMVAVTVLYLLAGTVLAPELWLDPLGAYVKTVPGAVLALVALAVAEER
jgi:uncharacterized protein YbjT (DUF2867 family)